MAEQHIEHMTAETFHDAVARGLTLVDFWAPWCGPCNMQGTILQSVAEKLNGRGRIVKVNIDEAPDLAALQGVQAIPTLILFDGGKEIRRFVGVQNDAVLLEAMTA